MADCRWELTKSKVQPQLSGCRGKKEYDEVDKLKSVKSSYTMIAGYDSSEKCKKLSHIQPNMIKHIYMENLISKA